MWDLYVENAIAEGEERVHKPLTIEGCREEELKIQIIPQQEKEWESVCRQAARSDGREHHVIVLAGTAAMLEVAKREGLALIAWLREEGEELFSYSYAVTGWNSLSARYLELVWCRAHHQPMKVLESERCQVWEMDEIAALALFEMGKHRKEWFDYQSVQGSTRELAAAYIRNVYSYYGYGMWQICGRFSKKPLGYAGISQIEIAGDPMLELSYYIAPKHRRHGYALEVCQAVVHYAAVELQAARICCRIQPDNIPSINLAHKLGFHAVETIHNLYICTFNCDYSLEASE